ncbi:MAG: Thymidylate kinase [Firmicutes bacterium ADurb.Bin373]|nr:dTMP kinase [Bacillota bacterium]OQA10342.1 MAG: Thymidylate kinase [Firmicutes bacterium ADurb.Bin373]
MKGKFIVFEGIDGSGKTTQLKLLGDKLKGRGLPVLYTREPGGTRVGEAIREILLNPAYSDLVPRAEALLYAAARAQHVTQVIVPALAAGTIVLCDRFLDSSLAYQGFGRGIDISLLERINEPATDGLVPDMTIILEFCAEDGMDRINKSGRPIDRIERETRAFYVKVGAGYLALAGRDAGRYSVIDANRPVEQVHKDVMTAAEGVLHEIITGNSRA